MKPGLTSLHFKNECALPGELRPNSSFWPADTLTKRSEIDSFCSVSVWPALWSLAVPSVNASASRPRERATPTVTATIAAMSPNRRT